MRTSGIIPAGKRRVEGLGFFSAFSFPFPFIGRYGIADGGVGSTASASGVVVAIDSSKIGRSHDRLIDEMSLFLSYLGQPVLCHHSGTRENTIIFIYLFYLSESSNWLMSCPPTKRKRNTADIVVGVRMTNGANHHRVSAHRIDDQQAGGEAKSKAKAGVRVCMRAPIAHCCRCWVGPPGFSSQWLVGRPRPSFFSSFGKLAYSKRCGLVASASRRR